MNLAGKTVILTGASGGIGAYMCRALVEAGASVMAVGRNQQRLAQLARELPIGRVHPVVADLATVEGRQHLVGLARQQQPAPSVLVMGHAQSAFGLFEEQDPAALEAMLQTNLVGSTLLVHAMLPTLRAQGPASVVVIGSTFGSLGYPGFAAYSASKFGLRGLMEALAREHAGTTLRFQYLAPRATRTAFNTPAVDALNAELKVASDAPEEVARKLMRSILRGDARRQLGWPEKLFARINGVLPALVDRSLRKQLPIIRRHAQAQGRTSPEKTPHETVPR
jgi:short-subunit dehydrogenase